MPINPGLDHMGCCSLQLVVLMSRMAMCSLLHATMLDEAPWNAALLLVIIGLIGSVSMQGTLLGLIVWQRGTVVVFNVIANQPRTSSIKDQNQKKWTLMSGSTQNHKALTHALQTLHCKSCA